MYALGNNQLEPVQAQSYQPQLKNPYDINRIPIIEEKVDSRLIKSFINSKKLFEDLKKDRNLKFPAQKNILG